MTPLGRMISRTRLGRTMLAYWPTAAIHSLSGTAFANVPRRVAKMFDVWADAPSTRQESTLVYGAYRGGDVIDVGAFHGWYSWLLAPKSKAHDRFISLEPDPAAAQILFENLGPLVKCFPQLAPSAMSIPVGDGSAFRVSHHGDLHPTYYSSTDGTTGSLHTVSIDSIVDCLALRPTFIKIDVEGAEFFVLKGAIETIRNYKPTVMLELHTQWQPAGVTCENVTSMLSDAGYMPTPVDAGENVSRQIWQYAP